MRVALTTTFSPWDARAGVAQFGARELAEALHARGVEVAVVYTMEGHAERRLESDTPYPVRWASVLRTVRRRGAAAMSEHAAPVAWALHELDRERRVSVVHGQGEEMALVPDALPRAKRVVSAHPIERSAVRRAKGGDDPGPCASSTRAALEMADAVVVAGARDMRASMIAPLVAWERVVAIERGVPRRFFGGDALFGAGAPTHLLVVGGSGDDAKSRMLLDGLRLLPSDRYLPVCWLTGFGEARRARVKAPPHLSLPPGVELLGLPDERSLQRLVGRASEIILLDGSDTAGELLRVAVTMGKRISTCEEAVCAVVTPLEGLALGGLPSTAQGFAELLGEASRRTDLRASDAHLLRSFAREHFSWEAVAGRHIRLYERLLRSGEEMASPTPDSD